MCSDHGLVAATCTSHLSLMFIGNACCAPLYAEISGTVNCREWKGTYLQSADENEGEKAPQPPVKSVDFCKCKMNLKKKNLHPTSVFLCIFPKGNVSRKTALGKLCPDGGNGFLLLLRVTLEINRKS